MTDIPEGVPLEGVELLQGEGYNELLYSHLLDGEGTRLTYTHFTAKVYLTFISFLNYWEQNTDHTKYSILYSCHHIFFHHFLFSSLLTVPSGNLEKRSNVCKQFRVHKNRKAGASQPSSKLAAWQLLGRPIFFKISLNKMEGGYFSRITLPVFQIEKYSEADSFRTLSPPPVSK